MQTIDQPPAGTTDPKFVLHRMEEAAKLLRISKRTIDAMALSGEIGSVKIRGRRFIRQADIEAYLMEAAR